ncbi:MAG TPA: dCTP deaminase, partial [Planctomycetes bacterium]|nr:dCTP deaminase [Planctomycetota bacterium]
MSVKSDRWIRRMAVEHRMIEPFSSEQVREGIDESGQPYRVISYGISSYGYDLRVADEFKVFTNVHGSVVDPKEFDERSFVDFKTDCCIIPPNSFALA